MSEKSLRSVGILNGAGPRRAGLALVPLVLAGCQGGMGIVSGLALLGAAAVAGAVLWRRSDRALAAAAFREYGKVSGFVEGAEFLDHVGIAVPLPRRKRVLEHFARRLEKAEKEPRQLTAEILHALARLLGLIEISDRQIRVVAPPKAAEAFDRFAGALEVLGERTRELGIRDGDVTALPVAAQARLFAAVMRAASPSHLAVLRTRLREVRQSFTAAVTALVDPELLDDLDAILDACEQLGRLPGAEDRALYLGQALNRALDARERLLARYHASPSHGATYALAVTEHARQILASTLRDLNQRALLEVELRSKVLTARREAVVVLEVRNVGQGHAQNVTVELLADDEHFRAPQPRQTLKGLLRDQSARLEYLIEPHASDQVRLRFHLTYDDLERRGHDLDFADLVQFRQVQERTYFPLRPNPYVVGRPLGSGDVFVGREETLERVASSLRGVHQDNVVILIGQRRMGKTSVLRRLKTRLGEGYLPVLVDLQGFLGAGEAAFFGELAATIHDELAENGVEVAEPEPGELAVDPGGAFRHRFLRDVRRALGERRLLVMIDELEVLEERIRTGELRPEILPYLRSLLQHEENVSFLFAGTHRLDELTGDYWSVLFNLAVYLDVGHFSRAEVEKLFSAPTRGYFEIDPLALDKVYQLTGGHPHFSQLVARELVEVRNRRALSYVTVQDVNLVSDTVVEQGQMHITYLWNEATRSERLLLLATQELLDREGLASTAAAHRYLGEHRIEPGDLPAAARALDRLEVLSAQGGQLIFRMDLLRRWLRRNHDLETFVMAEEGK